VLRRHELRKLLLTPTRDRDAAEAFLRKAISTLGLPEKITMRCETDRTSYAQLQVLLDPRCTIAGIEGMHAIRKGQLMTPGHLLQTPAEQFYALAA
jgi:hypothetical protein